MRSPEATRQKILLIAAEEIHYRGFKATSLADILASAEISKGALYHHFKNKIELGYAVMEEVFMPMFNQPWQQAYEHEDPLGVIAEIIRQMPQNVDEHTLESGCPMINMCNEMSTVDEGFRQRIETLFEAFVNKLAQEMPRSGLREDVNPLHAAMFILASMQGSVMIIKGCRCRETFQILSDELAQYVLGLRSQESKANAKKIILKPFVCPAVQLSERFK
ncbi:TetR/AcrR family transcriptional regulator [Psychrobium sp. 1_MG-2023]|uniref:TetR/AcrR family transcriptional regulator n=1 Tax=Psychrobium sp. 1_MG-2023 TaxID=3062624 RepID=UPI000C33D138|nr:TetR/AcrR family transcriptional regulator [Psychrobium sp. 1_MG-2023]MDP2562434.1 TetR/AcrR family transcriptional regulator [Psychrobium sp. 1_MG-2023]PKF56162.1 TetR/AcrR family transcriptional regulator [Alteromonadales bacterium alter-6D02]